MKGEAAISNEPTKQDSSIFNRIGTVVGILLCIILIPILIINITLIIRSYTDQESVPNFGGYLPLIVLTDSMDPGILSGDLIICHTLDASQVQEGDVIAFFDPAGNGTSVVTHRVIKVTSKDGSLAFQTQGDANNVADEELVPADKLVGIYKYRIAGAGNIAMFMQTTKGMVLCVVIPLLIFIGYDMIRRTRYERKKKQDTETLLAELESLRAANSNSLPNKE